MQILLEDERSTGKDKKKKKGKKIPNSRKGIYCKAKSCKVSKELLSRPLDYEDMSIIWVDRWTTKQRLIMIDYRLFLL